MTSKIDALALAREWRVVHGLDGEEILLLLVARGVTDKDAQAVIEKIAEVKPRRRRPLDRVAFRSEDS